MAETGVVPVKRGNGKLKRAEPIGLLDEFETEMDRFWRRPWSFWPGAWLRPSCGVAREALILAPRLDVYEKDNAIVVKSELQLLPTYAAAIRRRARADTGNAA